ncbi:Fic family protein [Microbacterium sp. KR10-403]|uniref:Fic family protein n=1 Tax=Microbacterium sp. KR10-403 TaxID=3158581 RepID=UPI0032E4713A
MRGGSREDRMLRVVDTSIPPRIADLHIRLAPDRAAAAERAVIEIATTDTDARPQPRALGRFMLRSESVASSKIERISASADDFARALAGQRSNSSATSMVAASTALTELIDRAGASSALTLPDLLDAHHLLMADDPTEREYAGTLRDMQNWIGGSDYSPRDALYVPPPPENVPALLGDLLSWISRDDIPVLAQAAIAHAQFESIHPFTDGNGRIGRALISAVFRRRGLTKNVVMPLAAGLLAVRNEYFDALTTYRQGDPNPIIDVITRSASVAAVQSRASLDALRALPAEWRALLPRARADAAVDSVIAAFFDNPVMGADEVVTVTGVTPASVYAAIDRLVDATVLTEITGRKRNRVWAALDALGELDELDRRIHAATRATH